MITALIFLHVLGVTLYYVFWAIILIAAVILSVCQIICSIGLLFLPLLLPYYVIRGLCQYYPTHRSIREWKRINAERIRQAEIEGR